MWNTLPAPTHPASAATYSILRATLGMREGFWVAVPRVLKQSHRKNKISRDRKILIWSKVA